MEPYSLGGVAQQCASRPVACNLPGRLPLFSPAALPHAAVPATSWESAWRASGLSTRMPWPASHRASGVPVCCRDGNTGDRNHCACCGEWIADYLICLSCGLCIDCCGCEDEWTCQRSDAHDHEQLQNRFTYHAPNEEQPARYTMLRLKGLELAKLICRLTPESREQSLALTKIEESIFWANAAIARNESVAPDAAEPTS